MWDSSSSRHLLVQGENHVRESEDYHLCPPVKGIASADHAKVVVGTVLALLLSCAAACTPPELATDLPQLARLLSELPPWLKCVFYT